MNNVVSHLMPAGSAGAVDPAAVAGAPTTDGGLFRATLADRLTPADSGLKTRQSEPLPDRATVRLMLDAKIAKMIASGVSQESIIGALAGHLTSSVAKLLGTPGSNARSELQAMFVTALAPPGNRLVDGTKADRGPTLAQRFIRLESVANALAAKKSGQQTRFLGNVLDARRAKDIPARAATDKISVTSVATIHHVGGQALASQHSLQSLPSNLHIIEKQDFTRYSDGNLSSHIGDLVVPQPLVAHDSTPRSIGVTDGHGDRHLRSYKLGPTIPATDKKPAPAIADVKIFEAVAPIDSTLPVVAGSARDAMPILATKSKPAPIVYPIRAAAAGFGSAVPPRADSSSPQKPARSIVGPRTANNPEAPAASGAQASAAARMNGGALVVPSATTLPAGTLPNDVQSLRRAPLPNVTPSALAGTAPSVAANEDAAGDARIVSFGSTLLATADGNTGLGRILTRALLVADGRQAPLASNVDLVSSTTTSNGTAAPDDASSDTVVRAFAKAFEAALNAAPAAVVAPEHDSQPAAGVLSVANHDVSSTALAVAPSVAPFMIDRLDSAATAAPATTPAPIDHSAIADQVLRGAFMRNVGQSSEMRLTLKPDSLGDVNVKLVVTAGSVTAHVLAQTPEVRDALVAAQPQLTKSLTDAGLKLTSFTVDLSGNGFAGFSQHNGQSQNNNRSHRSNNAADIDGIIDDTLIEAVPSFGPSVVSRPNAHDFNYLA